MSHITEYTKQIDNIRQMSRVNDIIENIPGELFLVSKERQLLFQGPIALCGAQDWGTPFGFLTNDMLLLCGSGEKKKYSVKQVINFNGYRVVVDLLHRKPQNPQTKNPQKTPRMVKKSSASSLNSGEIKEHSIHIIQIKLTKSGNDELYELQAFSTQDNMNWFSHLRQVAKLSNQYFDGKVDCFGDALEVNL
eukprot:TRINITY_DN9117_c0_g1_i1.p1 TRINITY_DN9117_c0_g1~~TRINITY_DN9117_c0_g1_i1.p1  ORF type:complete len:218 (-),score=29.81 TRINITY_DN9117_c0_g1_i1:497-1072(-)